jgi:hypothetical protein
MGNAGIVAAFLREHEGRWYCYACISRLTGIWPPTQVNQITRRLAQTAAFERRRSVSFSEGDHLRTCIRARA